MLYRNFSLSAVHPVSRLILSPLCATYTIRKQYRTNASLYIMYTTFIACSYSVEFLLLKLLRA